MNVMIKRLIFCALAFISLLSPAFAQAGGEPVRIGKLELKKRQEYRFSGRDSLTSIVIDTLIMGDESSIDFLNKKKVNLLIKYAVIGRECIIRGSDGKNNGTDIVLSVNFAVLNALVIQVPGLDAKMSNRKHDNGNGGKVLINYLSSGVKPQLSDPRQTAFIGINNRAGGYLTNAQTDLYPIYSQLNSGVPGRPLSQLPQGRVYSGGTGREGKSDIRAVNELAVSPVDQKTSPESF